MVYLFDSFELDLVRAELRLRGTRCPVEPQVFALIAFLVEHRERLVSRQELFEKVWDGRVVSDSALSSRIKSARKVLGDNGRAQRLIRTLHGQGFRFVAEVGIAGGAIGKPLAMPSEVRPQAGPGAGESAARPSIAVLPFRLIGDAGPYASIAEGLPHELISELARCRWLLVIARGSSFRLGGDSIDMIETGRRLDARYCLTGTVEVSGSRLTVTTELVDTRVGDVFWAERYRGLLDDVHAVREEIRCSILSTLEIQIPLHEADAVRLSVSEDLDAWSAYHLGLQHIYRFNDRDNAAAAALFSQAIERDPKFARAHAGLSLVHFQTAFMRQSEDTAGETALARRCAQRGMDLDPLDPFVNFTMGRSYWLEADLEQALAWLERAITLSPNYAQGVYATAWTEVMAGEADAARRHADLAMRLSPLDPLYYAMLGTRGFAHIASGEFAEAAGWADRAAHSPGAHVLIAMIAAVAQVLAGNPAKGSNWADTARARKPALTRDDFFHAFPMRSPAMRSRISGALQALGF
ncbi:MAG: winged helix-turn-helix domain-containing protein [Halioglobus sp.]|nr:winged helix-turn-helix domain-containing protein [Halioglobus sp.]